jgi:hypothetical protein
MIDSAIAGRAARLLTRAAGIILALVLASCPNEAPTDSPVVGTWDSVQTGIRRYVFASDGTVSLTVLDPSPTFLPEDVVAIDSPGPGATYAEGAYVVTASSHVFWCSAGGVAAGGVASALEAADSVDLEVGSRITDGGVTWELVDRIIIHGAWSLEGSTLTIAWTGAASRIYTLTFNASGEKHRMSMKGFASDEVSLTLELVET